ncbi:hypothetical protein [Halobacillus sp. A5]|uniref:hypothetical protein n=1 Tax=Halobacillus sp. A5 TaxID=2880263 RepID=UPI0020A65C36|nr:hypothetical protein [Halobacillus sp. A5]MCP3028193.1 hypothetical protein [Halobacillus sp. A5]
MKEFVVKVKEVNNGQEDSLKKHVAAVWGVRETKINSTLGELAVIYNEEAASPVDIKQAVMDSGFIIEE